MKPLTIAVPKGRILKVLAPLFRTAGVDADCLLLDDRTLVRRSADGSVVFLLLKPDDVPTYVEYGAAELGVSGRDTLLERAYDLYQPVDLGIGRCRMVVAGPPDTQVPATPRIATKFPRIAREHFARKGVQAEIIYVQGSVELGPVVGLSDFIVDLVETGATLKENNLVEREVICEVSSLLVANRSLYKLRHAEISAFIARLRAGLPDSDAS